MAVLVVAVTVFGVDVDTEHVDVVVAG